MEMDSMSHAAANQAAGAAEAADPLDRPASDLDVLTCYHLLLGREPENSFVMREAGQHTLRVVMDGFLDSGEFRTLVEARLLRGETIPQEQGTILPTGQHRAWIARVLRLSPAQQARIAGDTGWPVLLRAVLDALGRSPAGAAHDELGATLARVERKLRAVRTGLATLREG